MIRTPYTSDHYLELACRIAEGQGFICLLLYATVLLFAFCLITIYLFVTNLWQNYCRLLVGATANKDFLFARKGIAFQIANRDAYVVNPTEESPVFQ
jgi:hypothetical protein